MNTESLSELIAQGQEILETIRQHPDYKSLLYQPDLSISDAVQALDELRIEVLSSQKPVKIYSQGFSQ